MEDWMMGKVALIYGSAGPLEPTNLYGSDNYDPNNSHVILALIRKFHEAKQASAKKVLVWGAAVTISVLGTENRVWLFGSRVDDALRGGEIDLLIETEAVFANRAQTLCRLYGALIYALDECKLDILLKDARTRDAPVFNIAKRT